MIACIAAALAGGAFSASPIAADGRLYFANEDGQVYVVRAGNEYVQIAVNEMAEPITATPAIADGLMVVRTVRAVSESGRGKRTTRIRGQAPRTPNSKFRVWGSRCLTPNFS